VGVVVACEAAAWVPAERAPTAQPIARQAAAPATPAMACVLRRVPRVFFGVPFCSDIAGTSSRWIEPFELQRTARA
jgi:hypothetical protein